MWRLSTGYQENGEDFNPEVGYLRRPGGFRKYDLAINNRSRPDGFLKFQELRPHATFSRIWNLNGVMETTYIHTHFMGEFEDSSSVGLAYDTRSERVFQQFTVSGLTIPASRYDWSEVSTSFYYNRSAPVSAGVRAVVGGFFGGNIVTHPPDGAGPLRGDPEPLAELQPERHRPAVGNHRHQPDEHSRGLQLLPADVLPDARPAQRQRQALVGELPHRLAAGRQHRPVPGLQRDAGHLRALEDPHDYIPAGAGRSLILKYSYLVDVLD